MQTLQIIMKKKIIYSLSSNKDLARKISRAEKAELGRVSIDHFADGEILVKTLSDVKNKDVTIVESTAKNAHERLFELLLLIDSIKRGKPHSINLYIPYFGYSRQERVSWINEPISCQVVANILDTAKVDKILTFDLHHPDIKKFFKTKFVSIPTASLFGKYYREYIRKHKINPKDVIVVSPDHGSNTRADQLVKELPGSKKVILNKHRPAPNFVEHLEINNKNISGKTCIIVDDIIDTGGTIVSATNLLYKYGAKDVLACASHAVLSGNSVNKLLNANISDLVFTNSIETDLVKSIKIIDISSLIEL